MEIRTLSLNELNPAPYNPRTIDDKALSGLKASIDRFGCVELIVWNKRTGNIVSGHQRYKVLQSKGVDETDVVVVDLDDADEKALNVAMNNPHIAGQFTADLQTLLQEIKIELPELYIGLELKPLEIAMPKAGNTDPDEIPEVEEATCQPGQIWQLGMHRLMCGDSTDAEQVALLMDGTKAHLCLTDPPYGIGETYQSYDDNVENLKELIKGWFPLALNNSEVLLFTPGNKNQWFYPKPDWVLGWFTGGGSGCNPWGFTSWHAVYAYGKDPYLAKGLGSRPDAVSKIDTSDVKVGHPSQKPLSIWEWFLERGSITGGQIVYDPFLGSGTTLIACERTDRACYGMEIDPHYCDVIIKRWEDYTGYKAHLTNG